jgi:transcriptional regulator with XRE-family HTH domain
VRRLDPKRVISNIGPRIAELRVARGWTQEAFAEVLGMATQNVARIEQGRADFRVTTLVRLATALGCDPQLLLGTAYNAEAAPRAAEGDDFWEDGHVRSPMTARIAASATS